MDWRCGSSGRNIRVLRRKRRGSVERRATEVLIHK
jgi:hypothetical protein